MNILEGFQLDANFWDMNPQLAVAFREVYEKDTSANKKESSKLLWGIALLCDPESKFNNIGEEDRMNLIAVDWFNDPNFDWNIHEKTIQKYINLCLSSASRELQAWKRKIEERSRFIESVPYNESNYEMLDKMMVGTERIFRQYEAVIKLFTEEKAKGSTRGGAMESASEQGLI